jgi:hypothetical protein
LLRKKSLSRHSGEACAGLDPVAGVQKLLKKLDSGLAVIPDPDPGRNDNQLIF